MIKFVQVTIAKKHAFKLRYFLQALKALKIPPGDGWTVKVLFVVPLKRLEEFMVEPVYDSGSLVSYGWECGKEAERADVVGINVNV
eukprot:756593-Hanusia_phi.AAC.2